jgi:rhodanese-related sulfurtransferase
MSKKRNRSKTASAASNRRHSGRRQNRMGLWIGSGIVILVVAVFLLITPGSTPAAEISVAQAYEKYQQGAFFLDVRTQEEWDEVHLAESVLIPLDDLQSRLGELPRDQEIVVICRSGNRSEQGVAILREAGFNNVTGVDGGIRDWVAAGYATGE